ncbi:MAG: Eco57I restriction-modification methylase domain-containing protein [Clostridia bacterium]|jgi:hypothetical protein|nr:Eco57I restriction-modification methylase domain-containing protein [Clostridia bacterium]
MELSNIVLPQNFSEEKWTDYFDLASDVFTENKASLPRFTDDYFSQISTLGQLCFADHSSCCIYLIKTEKALSERASRKKQFDKAIDILRQEKAQSGLFVFHDAVNNFRFSLVYPVYKGTKRSFSNYKRHSFYVSDSLSNKTYLLQLQKHDLNSMTDLLNAFSVDKVSEVFYDEFEKQYAKLQAAIHNKYKQDVESKLKGDFALLFVLRIIFLGFVQKKAWLGGNPNFIADFIASYDPALHPGGIYAELLSPLFFEALNSAPSCKSIHAFPNISEPFKSQLVKAPYLNGGLFRKHDSYDLDALYIQDDAIKEFTSFLFSFNFTLEENTLYDEELELNPEFLGIIFEKLVNKEHGAIYTPRLEVDFMCRLSLVKYLQQNCLSSITAENLYKLFFSEYGDESEQSAGVFSPLEAKDILQKLETVTVCDPAIGSGAFAVGMLNVIDEIECTIHREFMPETPIGCAYDRKKRIIFESLYGVEVKQWAVWITQLRLWITLLIEADDDMLLSEEPLLPSFDFKIRQGDSLIQMLGNSLIPVTGEGIISRRIKDKISELMKLKTEYYHNKCPLKLHDIELKQHQLYIELLNDQKKELLARLKRLENAGKSEVQSSFLDTGFQAEIEISTKKQELEISKLRYCIAELDHDTFALNKHNLPFIWRIDFPEIFGTRGGFDIVVGNPPYVAQEQIEDPLGKISDAKTYKALLRKMVHLDFPQDIPEASINGKSDLYTFFYIRGIRLLNRKGIHCYICSNSWLDVEFGAWLQKFLLESCPIHFIIDNLAKRVFKHAGINTIISIVGAHQKLVRADDKIRFVAFKLPFENSLYTENFLAIEETTHRKEYDDLRVNAIDRDTLSKEGWADSKEKKYSGSKWGGIYIKAPSIYFTIMEKAKDKLVRLGDIADVKFGIKTGADEFFYIPKTNPHNIEQEFLRPVIKSPKECKSILINPDDLGLWLFMCPHKKSELKGTNALKYIEMGEQAEKYIKQGKDKGKTITGIQNVSTVKGRKHWYDLGNRKQAQLITPSSFGDTFKVYINNGVFANKRLYEIYFNGFVPHLALALNSSLFYFFVELYSSTCLGDGLLDKTVAEIESTPIITPDLLKDVPDIEQRIDSIQKREIKSIFDELQVDQNSGHFNNANPLQDRKALDEVVFKALGLTDSEIEALYAGLLELTANRLRKANTFK